MLTVLDFHVGGLFVDGFVDPLLERPNMRTSFAIAWLDLDLGDTVDILVWGCGVVDWDVRTLGEGWSIPTFGKDGFLTVFMGLFHDLHEGSTVVGSSTWEEKVGTLDFLAGDLFVVSLALGCCAWGTYTESFL